MPSPIVQSNSGNGSSGTLAMTAGNVYTFALKWTGTPTSATVVDSHGVTATPVAPATTDVDGNKLQYFVAAVSVTGNNTVAATTASLGTVQCTLTEWTGVTTTVRAIAAGAMANSGAPSPGAIAGTVAGDVVIVFAANTTGTGPTAGTGYTQTSTFAFNWAQTEEYAVSGGGSVTPGFTQAASWWAAIGFALEPTAATTAPTSDFTTSVNQKTVTLMDASTAGTNPIASYDTDWGDSTAHATTANASHTYATGGKYTITHVVSDGTLTGTHSANATTATRHTYTVVTNGGGGSASVTADVPDA